MSEGRRTRSQAKAEQKDAKKTSWGEGGLFGSREFGALSLIILCPLFLLLMWYIMAVHKGDVYKFYKQIERLGFQHWFGKEFYPKVNPWNPEAWKMIAGFSIFELLLQRFVPGKTFEANATVNGHKPKYVENGVPSYFISIATLFYLKYSGYYNPGRVYDMMGHLLGSINVFAIFFCALLTVKGLTYPSTKEAGSNGSFVMDYFWGTELYPNILGWDVKQFTNCRFGMMFWQIGILCYMIHQYDQYKYVDSAMLISVIVQSVYIFKFFLWETGYFNSMDIQHDRAGYYICYGCLCWVPSIYTFHTFWLTMNPLHLSEITTFIYTTLGVLFVWINYDCDKQRFEFRRDKGEKKIWGEDPDYIEAKYQTEDGEKRVNLLLCSGWWGMSRHIHYVPEILASIMWCVPAHNTTLQYFYPFYLTLLLLDRAYRDDARCAAKYGKYWDEYCEKVPYKIIPGII